MRDSKLTIHYSYEIRKFVYLSFCIRVDSLHGKNYFADKSKILLNKSENKFVGTLKIMSNAAKNFDILTTDLNVLHNYVDSSTKSFLICIQLKFFIFQQNRSFRVAKQFFDEFKERDLYYKSVTVNQLMHTV